MRPSVAGSTSLPHGQSGAGSLARRTQSAAPTYAHAAVRALVDDAPARVIRATRTASQDQRHSLLQSVVPPGAVDPEQSVPREHGLHRIRQLGRYGRCLSRLLSPSQVRTRRRVWVHCSAAIRAPGSSRQDVHGLMPGRRRERVFVWAGGRVPHERGGGSALMPGPCAGAGGCGRSRMRCERAMRCPTGWGSRRRRLLRCSPR
jgi:hypothetical protein